MPNPSDLALHRRIRDALDNGRAAGDDVNAMTARILAAISTPPAADAVDGDGRNPYGPREAGLQPMSKKAWDEGFAAGKAQAGDS